jgi:hypothetical protein
MDFQCAIETPGGRSIKAAREGFDDKIVANSGHSVLKYLRATSIVVLA